MLEVQNLVKEYGNVRAVDGISFKAEEGRIYGLLGKNGAGKSTTMNIITGYIGATSGSVTVDGYDIFKDAGKARRHIGYLPEIPPLYSDMTVYEYLDFCADLKGIRSRDRDEAVFGVMQRVKIEDVENRLIRNLSKGYRQRVGLAQALIGYPEIIILDEPTVGLDPSQMIEMREMIRELGKEHIVILSSHILSEIQAVCDYVFIIDEGKLVASDYVSNLSHHLNKESEISLIVKGDREQIENIIRDMEHVSAYEIQKLDDSADRFHLVVHVESESDIRENLSVDLSQAGVVIFEMRENKQSLEDIFIEITDKEEIR